MLKTSECFLYNSCTLKYEREEKMKKLYILFGILIAQITCVFAESQDVIIENGIDKLDLAFNGTGTGGNG